MPEFFPGQAAGALVYKTDSNGFHAGTVDDPDNVDTSGGIEVSGALYIPYVIDFDAPEVTYSELIERSGQQVRQRVNTGVSDISSFATNLSRFMDDISEMSHDIGTNTTFWGGATIGGAEQAPKIFNNLGLVLFQQGRVPVGGGYANNYKGYVYGSTQIVQAQPGGSQAEGENPNPVPTTITPSNMSVFPTGTDLSDITGLGYSGGETLMVPVLRDEMFHIATAWLDGTETTFTLPYLPTSSDATAGGANLITLNGTPVAVTSVNTATGVVTLASAGTEGDIVVVMYPTNYVPSPTP